MNATFTGIHDHDHRLPDWSPEGLAAALDEMKAVRTSLISARSPDTSTERVPPHLAADAGIRGEMSASARRGGGAPPPVENVGDRDRKLAISFLDVQIAEHESGHFQHSNPSLAAGEAVFGVVSLMTRPFAPAADRADAAITRLTAVPAFLDGARRSISAGIPHEWRAKCLRECDGAARLFGDGLRRWIAVESIDDRRANRLTQAAGQAAAAFDEFRHWLVADARRRPLRVRSGPLRSAAGARALVRPLADRSRRRGAGGAR